MNLTQNGPKLVQAFNKIPGPVSLPVVGTLYLYKLGIFNALKYHEVLDHMFKTYGPLVREKFGSSTVIHVFDPEDSKTIYQNEGKMPYITPLQETAQLYRQKANLSLGLGNINGEEWYRLRAAVRHLMLKPKDVQQFLPAVHGVARDLIKRFQQIRDKQGFVSDLATEIGKWSQESAGVVCFEKRLGYLGEGVQQAVIEEVIQANRTVFYLSMLLKFSLPIYKSVPTPKWRKMVQAEDIVVRTANNYTTEAIESIARLSKNNELTGDQYSFIVSLLAKPQLSRKDIEIVTLSLFNDGLSTTVPAVLHNLYCLATNPEVQEKAYEEVYTVVGMSDEITSAHLSQLNYLKAVVKETFRMYPIGTEISRIPQEDLILSNYYVPAQSNININMGVHFRSENYFASPELFMPERWLRGGAADSIHPYILTPFGFGTRTCAGRRFAEQDMYVLLAEIVRNFRLTYESNQPLELMYHTLLLPAHPLPIRFIPRQQ